MDFQRVIAHILFSIMLMVQVHAAVPHEHVGPSGRCGVVCDAHQEDSENWWEVVMESVHHLVHRHAETAACEWDDEVFRPASELEFTWAVAFISTSLGTLGAWEALGSVVAEFDEPFLQGEPLKVRPLRGPPSRG